MTISILFILFFRMVGWWAFTFCN